MKVTTTITIAKPIDEVWQVLAQDFDNAYLWMAQVNHSYKQKEGTAVPNAPVCGRVCEFSGDLEGISADEEITFFDPNNHVLKFTVTPKNAKKFPIERNLITVTMETTDEDTLVTWSAEPVLKGFKGKIMAPMLKVFLKRTFNEILEELKHFVETGEPHPRKVAANAKAQASNN